VCLQGDSVEAALSWAQSAPGVLELEMQQLVAKAAQAAKNPPTGGPASPLL